jgi:acetyl esterase/lipase
VLAPGGGFNIVMLEHEGWRVARRLAAEGLTVFVLKYRHFAPTAAFADGRRAVRLVRVRAAEWNVDPARIGLGGFSAGGRLALGVAALPEGREDRELDSLAAVSARPDFLLLVYPSPFRALGNDAVVDAGFPPSFIVGTVEDHPAARVHDLALRLRAANVRHEAHVFSAGAHGFALGEALPGTSRWPELFESWLRDQIAPSGGMKSATLTDEPAWGQPRGTRAVAPSPPEASARPPPPTP